VLVGWWKKNWEKNHIKLSQVFDQCSYGLQSPIVEFHILKVGGEGFLITLLSFVGFGFSKLSMQQKHAL